MLQKKLEERRLIQARIDALFIGAISVEVFERTSKPLEKSVKDLEKPVPACRPPWVSLLSG